MDKARLGRGGRLLAPSLFTMGNMACGFYSLIASDIGDFRAAATAILAGGACDVLDGRVARMVHGESAFGVEFDSLADFLTFGVAPAYMMYSFVMKDYGPWGAVVAFLYALCGALRLARFNAFAQAGSGPKAHFQGLPIPAGAGFLASFVLLYGIIEQARPGETLGVLMRQLPLLVALGPALMLGLAALMVSSIPYSSFKTNRLFEKPDLRALALAGFGLLLVYFYPQNTVFLIFLIYVLSGVVGLVRKQP